MKTYKKIGCAALSVALLLPLGGCTAYGTLTPTGADALTGGGIGATVGSLIGGLAGGYDGSAIGALIGGAVGAGAGAAIGSQMEQQQAALQQQLNQIPVYYYPSQNYTPIQAQGITDANNLKAIRLVLPDAILFPQGSSELSPLAQATLSRVAYNLEQYTGSDATIVGYTDGYGTEAQDRQLSQQRADVVMNYLIGHGVAPDRLQAVGAGSTNPVVEGTSPEAQAQNRRVEIFITASRQMIDSYQQQ